MPAMFTRRSKPLPCADNLRLYLSSAVLPKIVLGASAPPMVPDGHKSHLNHLRVQPEDYRSRFARILPEKDPDTFDNAVLDFCEDLPNKKLDLPNGDESTGFAFTVPAPGFTAPFFPSPHPTTIQELKFIVLGSPLHTLTRAMNVAFPEAAEGWEVTPVVNEVDAALWQTSVWRKVPPPSSLETYWLDKVNPLETCSVVFVVQPPWVLTPQDIKSFMNCSGLPAFNPWESKENKPYNAAERLWAKLWDTCVRRSCHHWVLTTYWGWVFGGFSQGFTAGQVFALKTYDCQKPTILQCLVHHVASSMGLATSLKLPQHLERHDQIQWNANIPEETANYEIEFPDSGSEWDGMDDELEISAGLSDSGFAILSAHGSEQEFHSHPSVFVMRTDGRRGYRRVPLTPEKASSVMEWQTSAADLPPPYNQGRERSPSVAPSESAYSSFADMFRHGSREGSAVPDVDVVGHNGGIGFGGLLASVPEQEAT